MNTTLLRGVLFVALLTFSFSFVSATVDFTSPYYFFDFEDMPVTYEPTYCGASYQGCLYPYISNGSRDGDPLQSSDFRVALNSTDPQTTFNKVGDWAFQSIDMEQGVGHQAYPNFYALMNAASSPSPVTWTFWVYVGSDDGISTPLFHDGARAGSVDRGVMFVVNDVGDIIIDGDCRDTRYLVLDTNLSKDTWYHLVIGGTGGTSLTHADIANDGGVFLNGNPVGVTMVNMTETFSGVSVAPFCQLFLGAIDPYSTNLSLCYDTWENATKPDPTTDFVYMLLDDLGAYQVQFNQSDAQTLYNGGVGLNPFDPEPPIVTEQPPDIVLDTSDYEYVDFRDYFGGGVDYYVWIYNTETDAWDYTTEAWVYNVSYNGDTVIVLSYLDTDTLNVYSYDREVSSLLRYMACNGVGCTNTSTLFVRVGGSYTSFPLPDAYVGYSPDDLTLDVGENETIIYGDYFELVDDTPEYVLYIYNIAGSSLWTRLEAGDTGSLSCLNYTATAFSINLVATSPDCEYRAKILYQDEYDPTDLSDAIFTDVFTIKTVGAGTQDTIADVLGADTSGIFGNMLRMFPNTDNNATKLFIVVCALLIVIGSAGAIAYNGSGTLAGFVGGLGSVVVVIFFSVIGYIPIWMIALIILGGVLIGAGFFRQSIMGGI